MTSFKVSRSVANVELATEGLFLMLGKMTPPFLVNDGLAPDAFWLLGN